LGDVVDYLVDKMYVDSVVLFGSLSKLEVSERADIDLAIFTKFKKGLDLKKFEKKLGKEIQTFVFESLDKVNKELRIAIVNGYTLKGVLR